MNDTEREKRNARRRKDPYRPLEYVMLFISTMDGLLDVSAKQCQDYISMLKYLAMHPMMGDFIPGAATWGKEKCMRMLQIRGKISADCPLFYRENGGIRCKGKTIEEIAQLIEERITNKDNATGGGGVKSTGDRLHDRTTEKEEEEEKEYIRREPPPISPAAAQADDGAQDAQPHAEAVEGTQATAAGTPPRPADSQLTPQGVRDIFAWTFKEAGVTDEQYLNECVSTFLDQKEASRWTDGNGEPIMNRVAATRAYAKACAKNYAADTKTPQELEGAWDGRPTLEQVAEYFRGWITDDGECESASIAFRLEMNGRNWKTTRGNPMKNWQRMAANFIERYMRRAHPEREEVITALGQCRDFQDMPHDELLHYVDRFIEWLAEEGWRTERGNPIADWRKCIPRFIQMLRDE